MAGKACGVGMVITIEQPFTVQLMHEGRSAHRSALLRLLLQCSAWHRTRTLALQEKSSLFLPQLNARLLAGRASSSQGM
jgi:hypothetical protein